LDNIYHAIHVTLPKFNKYSADIAFVSRADHGVACGQEHAAGSAFRPKGSKDRNPIGGAPPLINRPDLQVRHSVTGSGESAY